MASTATDAVVGAAPVTSNTTTQIQTAEQSKPVEMSNLNPNTEPETPLSPNQTFEDAVQQQPPATPSVDAVVSPAVAAPVPADTTTTQPPPPPPPTNSTARDALKCTEIEHLGPATEAPIAHPTTSNTIGPVLSISLMLTTGARHPYKIDEKYLRNRKVTAKNSDGDFEPRELSGYQLKELIWTDWRSEWEPRPVSPSSIRLIVMGRMIEDKMTLKDFLFNLQQTNVVHMTVKPADLIDDDEAGAGKGTGKGGVARARDGEDRGAGCRCIIL